jgi:hypothetical protein
MMCDIAEKPLPNICLKEVDIMLEKIERSIRLMKLKADRVEERLKKHDIQVSKVA